MVEMRLDHFVRIKVEGTYIWGLGDNAHPVEGTYIWGLGDNAHPYAFIPLWSRDWRMALNEFGVTPIPGGTTEDERAGAVLCNETNTPDEAWAALAYYRLTGERMDVPE